MRSIMANSIPGKFSMNKILITGATGSLGGATLVNLLKSVSAENVSVLVRDPVKAVDLREQGVASSHWKLL
jgi:FlaA1/EpsC-like NDP-sugar epimerase